MNIETVELKIQPYQNLVKINQNNQVVTSSLDVSQRFNMEHKNVLRRINALNAPNDFIALNFAPYSYIAKNGKKNPAYEMTFDGFTLLAMGFTGKKAMEFKIKYIRAFRAMEAKLKELASKPVVVSEHNRALPSGRKEIVLSEKAKEEVGGIVKAVIHSEIAKLLKGSGERTEHWEVSDGDLLFYLYHWHSTKNKKDTLEFQRLHRENETLKCKLNSIKKAID